MCSVSTPWKLRQWGRIAANRSTLVPVWLHVWQVSVTCGALVGRSPEHLVLLFTTPIDGLIVGCIIYYNNKVSMQVVAAVLAQRDSLV
jgi:hypothetical protein